MLGDSKEIDQFVVNVVKDFQLPGEQPRRRS